jgi:hypothetical protein
MNPDPTNKQKFRSLLPKLDGVDKVVGLDEEIWSSRKALQRVARPLP